MPVPPAAPLEAGLAMDPDDLGEPANDEPVDVPVERRQAKVTSELHGARLDKTLVSMAGEFSRNHLQSLIEAGHVWIDGRPQASASRKVLAGQVVTVELTPTQECQAFRPEAMSLEIVHEDEHLMVVNKPAGMVVHPAAGNWSGTLLNGLLAHHAGAATLPRAGIVHRLDKDTSGLMLVAKNDRAHLALSQALAKRQIEKHYLAVVAGQMKENTGKMDGPIARSPKDRKKMAVVPGGREALTLWRMVRQDEKSALVMIRLITGRTHQIRVHFSQAHHPVLGDPLYGHKSLPPAPRLMLHAWSLAFVHPVTGEPMAFTAPPEDSFGAPGEAELITLKKEAWNAPSPVI